MEEISKGDIVFVPFPYSNLAGIKNRPAVVLSTLAGDDVVLCQITSKEKFDGYSIILSNHDFQSGALIFQSTIRPNKLFTAERSIVLFKVGALKELKFKQVIEKVCDILKA
ncbi:TPA: type II toxin-antitoxin system PemK/MazF family toxin [archaeon]|nr:type II toxin-antitoxin system PemK/MazF family toxin [Candidatus Naiadarchaeales archaeon SRR2090153.bin461]